MVYFFQAGVLFSSENVKGTAFSKVHSENINTSPHICSMKISDTPSQVLNAPCHVTNTPSRCRRDQVRQPKQHLRQPKQQVCPILIYAVLSQCYFFGKFTHFSGLQFTGQKRGGVQKMIYIYMRYGYEYIYLFQKRALRGFVFLNVAMAEKHFRV